jgi:hypothetical protein
MAPSCASDPANAWLGRWIRWTRQTTAGPAFGSDRPKYSTRRKDANPVVLGPARAPLYRSSGRSVLNNTVRLACLASHIQRPHWRWAGPTCHFLFCPSYGRHRYGTHQPTVSRLNVFPTEKSLYMPDFDTQAPRRVVTSSSRRAAWDRYIRSILGFLCFWSTNKLLAFGLGRRLTNYEGETKTTTTTLERNVAKEPNWIKTAGNIEVITQYW